MTTHKCECGNVIELQKYRYTAEEVAYADGEDYTLEVEVQCVPCGALYQIEVEATITVTSGISKIECVYKPSLELNGVNLSDLTLGDSIDAPDGLHEIGGSQYLIENGKLITIFSALVDENQLQLAI